MGVCLQGGASASRGKSAFGASASGGLHPGGSANMGVRQIPRVCIYGEGVCMREVWADPLELETRKAGSTHPTGMLSCSKWVYVSMIHSHIKS